MNNLDLAMKHGAQFYDAGIWDAALCFKDESSLDALLAEHLAVNSSQPVAWMYKSSKGTDIVEREFCDNLCKMLPKDCVISPLYTANPLNQELLDAVKSLREAMKIARGYANDVDDDYIVGLFDKALASLSPNVTKLLESKDE